VSASPAERQTSQDVVISNQENVQTISVTITNTTTQRKSYAKDRPIKKAGAEDLQGPGDHKATLPQAMLEGPPPLPSITASEDHGQYY
jgi:hypothetical protein